MNDNNVAKLPGFTGAFSLGTCLQTYGGVADHQAGREQIILETNGCPAGLVTGVGTRSGPTEPIALSRALTAAFEDFLRRCPPPCFFTLPPPDVPSRRAACRARLGFSPNPIVCGASVTLLCLPERPAVPVPELAPVPEVVIPPLVVTPPVPVPVPEVVPVPPPVVTPITPPVIVSVPSPVTVPVPESSFLGDLFSGVASGIGDVLSGIGEFVSGLSTGEKIALGILLAIGGVALLDPLPGDEIAVGAII